MSQGHPPPIRPSIHPGPSMEPIQAQVVPGQQGQQGTPFNPYEASVAADLVGDAYRPPEQVPMPLSVVIAVICICLLAAINALSIFGNLRTGRVEWVAPSGFTVSVLVLIGMFTRHRMAWQWGRVLCILGAILTTLTAGIGVFMAIAAFNKGPNLQQLPPGMTVEQYKMFTLFAAGLMVIIAALQWTIFASLGYFSAREYFGLVCPRCAADEASANDFFFNQAKCGRCQNVW